jgi:DNA polymerase III alpha subunit
MFASRQWLTLSVRITWERLRAQKIFIKECGENNMNIQDEMNRIFKMQKDNLANERKFIQRCKNGVGEWEVLPNFETFDTRKEAEDFLDGERKSSKMRNAIYIVYAVNLKQLARMGTHILQEAHDVLVMENNRAGFYLMGNCLLHFSY